ncbi:flavodoxin [Corynebacterium sp. 335C]
MTETRRLLIVQHAPSDLLAELAAAVEDGARDPDVADAAGEAGMTFEVRALSPLEATSDDLLGAHGVICGTSANFGYISGALKHFFDVTFRECHEAGKGLPFAYWIRGGHDVTGAVNAMESITGGYGWSQVAAPVTFVGAPDDATMAELRELGGTVAAHAAGLMGA